MKTHERIKDIREAKRISQAEMAERLGIATQNYWKIEKGNTELTVSRLFEIAKILDISVLSILGEEGKLVKEVEEKYISLLEKASSQTFNYMSHIQRCFNSLNSILKRETGWGFMDLLEPNIEAENAIKTYINDGRREFLFYLLGCVYLPSEIEAVFPTLLKIFAPFTDSEKLLLVYSEDKYKGGLFYRDFLSL